MPERDANQLAADAAIVRQRLLHGHYSVYRSKEAEAAFDRIVALVGTLQQEAGLDTPADSQEDKT